MTSFGGNNLNTIGGNMILTGLTAMSTLGFPSLTNIGSIQWTALDALQQVTFSYGLTQISSIAISNTGLNKLIGFNPSTVASININNNPNLTAVQFQLTNITESLSMYANGGLGFTAEFPNLIWAYNMTLGNVTSIALDALTVVNNTLIFPGSPLEAIAAPNLTTVGGDLLIASNPDLQNISMPALKTVGGEISITNNIDLIDIGNFESLQSTGAINFSGSFSK
jgi:hypothetical protein